MFSRILRRTHMYLALFLAPWMLMYALSTMAMNHRGWFAGRQGPGPPPFVHERTLAFDGALPDVKDARAAGAVLLAWLGFEGAYNASWRPKEGTLVIHRHGLVNPRRITYTPDGGGVVVERQEFRANAFLERFHRRRGYMHDFLVDDVWAFSVDLVIAAMLFWALSGVWLWWEMKGTRGWGALAAGGGAALFAAYLVFL
jgi:hypothetical protein